MQILVLILAYACIGTDTGTDTKTGRYQYHYSYWFPLGIQVGFKPAGGIRTSLESLLWLILVKEELGSDWLCPQLFRLGASSLLADIERQVGVAIQYSTTISTIHDMTNSGTTGTTSKCRNYKHSYCWDNVKILKYLWFQIYHHATGQYADYHELPMA